MNMNIEEIKNINFLRKIIKRGIGKPEDGAFLWVGAGMSRMSKYPSLVELAALVKKESCIELDVDIDDDPLKIIDAYSANNQKGDLNKLLSDVFNSSKPPTEVHYDLLQLPWKGIITTNYDELIEKSLDYLKINGLFKKEYRKILLEENIDIVSSYLPVYKIHGDINSFKNCILDSKSYETFKNKYPLLKADLESALRKQSIVYFGCSMKDRRLLDWLEGMSSIERNNLRSSCTIMTQKDWDTISENDQMLLNEGGIKPLLVTNYSDIGILVKSILNELPINLSDHEFRFSMKIKDDKFNVVLNNKKSVTIENPLNDNFLEKSEGFLDANTIAQTETARKDLIYKDACEIGDVLSSLIFFDDEIYKTILTKKTIIPLLIIESDDDQLLSLPWELLRFSNEFLLREGRIDLVRTVMNNRKTLLPPANPMQLLVNISAPEGNPLNYEEESYRIAKIFCDHPGVSFTELGTVDDLINGFNETKPTGIHFSGHGQSGTLVFEDEEGYKDNFSIKELIRRLRMSSSNGFPSFFYLACCHGNTQKKEKYKTNRHTSASMLQREGIIQVICYYGAIIDKLSTIAEEAIYKAIAMGKDTVYAVRQARLSLSKDIKFEENINYKTQENWWVSDNQPFAWSQLVLYHNGNNYPLGTQVRNNEYDFNQNIQRTFESGNRKIIIHGFVGRRKEIHNFRRKLKKGQGIFVFQGFGGIGKTTLALKVIPLVYKNKKKSIILWCNELIKKPSYAEAFVNEFSESVKKVYGKTWNGVVKDAQNKQILERFNFYLEKLLLHKEHTVIYLDNLDTLLNLTNTQNNVAFGNWKEPDIKNIWKQLELFQKSNSNKLTVIASCRYRNDDFKKFIIPVPEMKNDAILRMMGWFDNIRKLSLQNRIKLTGMIQGHPRTVEYLETIIEKSLESFEDIKGEWTTPESKEEIADEWHEIIKTGLPDLKERLNENLLLEIIWKDILNYRCRRMLIRLSILVHPWDRDLMMKMGEIDDKDENVQESIEQLRRTGLLTQIKEKNNFGKYNNLFNIHQLVKEFICKNEGAEGENIKEDAYLRMGIYFEKKYDDETIDNKKILVFLFDAGHYYFEAGKFNKSAECLVSTSNILQEAGRVRDGLSILIPFIKDESAQKKLSSDLKAKVLNTMGLAWNMLSKNSNAIKCFGQAIFISKRLHDRIQTGLYLGNLGNVYKDLGKYKYAIKYHSKALGIAISENVHSRQGNDLGNLGNCFKEMGNIKKAVTYYEKALSIAKETDDKHGLAIWLSNLGGIYFNMNQPDKAVDYYKDALELNTSNGDRRGEGIDFGNIGNVYARQQKYKTAMRYLEKALIIARETEDRVFEGRWIGSIGFVYIMTDRVGKALEFFKSALLMAEKIGDKKYEGIWKGNIGVAYEILGYSKIAQEFYKQALNIAEEIGDNDNKTKWQLKLNIDLPDFDTPEKSEEQCKRELKFARKHNDEKKEAYLLFQLSKIFYKKGLLKNSIEHGKKALFVINHQKNMGLKVFVLVHLSKVYYETGSAKESIIYCNEALPLTGDKKNGKELELLILGSLGLAYNDLSEWQTSVVYHEKSLSIAIELGFKSHEANQLGNLGSAYRELRLYDKANGFFNRAIEIMRKIDDITGEGDMLGNLGVVCFDVGKIDEALNNFNKALDIARKFKKERSEANWLNHLAQVYRDKDDFEHSLELYKEALRVTKKIGDERGEGAVTGNIGQVYNSLGDSEKALEYHEKALEITGRLGGKRYQSYHLANQGLAYFNLGEIDLAIEHYEKALFIARKINDKHDELKWLANIGYVFVDANDKEKALDYFKQALPIAIEIEDKIIECQLLFAISNAYLYLNNIPEFITYQERAVSNARIINKNDMIGAGLITLGFIYNSMGNSTKAMTCLTECLEIAKDANNQELHDKAYAILNKMGN